MAVLTSIKLPLDHPMLWIAAELNLGLNLGLDSLVFYEDNPAERALVSQFLPDIWVVDVPSDASQFSRALQMSFAFEWPHLTLEDLGRAQTYVQPKQLAWQNANPSDFAAYLRSLQMEASVARLTDNGSARFHQLINKTNQFNLRTVRYSELEIESLKSRSDYLLLDVQLKDVHVNYGGISNVVLRVGEDEIFIENWVMSCRTFKRGVEDMVFEAIKKLARNLSKRFIVGEYRATGKNGYVANLLPTLGLSPWSPAERLRYGDGNGQLFRAAVDELGSRSHDIAVSDSL